MIKRLVSTSAIATALAVMPSSLALAQSDEVDSRNPASNEMADECIIAMNDFAQRMYQDDFWTTGTAIYCC
jgi:hypothetical protein